MTCDFPRNLHAIRLCSLTRFKPKRCILLKFNTFPKHALGLCVWLKIERIKKNTKQNHQKLMTLCFQPFLSSCCRNNFWSFTILARSLFMLIWTIDKRPFNFWFWEQAHVRRKGQEKTIETDLSCGSNANKKEENPIFRLNVIRMPQPKNGVNFFCCCSTG